MIPFKRAFIEGLLAETEMPAGYKNPTPKATFQLDDIVLVRSNGSNIKEMQDYFEGIQPKKYYRYFNNVGKVIGYKPGAMSAKYAIEFSDGTIGSFNTAHLKGPFISTNAAEIASKQKDNRFAPELSSKFVHRDDIIPINKPLEDYFKDLFVNSSLGFTWLDTPIVIPGRGRDEQVAVLAHKLRPSSFKSDETTHPMFKSWNSELSQELKDSFLFIKAFNGVTGKFSNNTNYDHHIWTARMQLTNPRTGYYIQLPTFSNANYAILAANEEQDYRKSLCLSTIPINNSFEKHLRLCVSNFERAKKVSKITTFEQYFDTILFNVTKSDGVKTIIQKEVHIDLQHMPANFDLSKYKIKGSCVLETSKQFFNFPKEVTGHFKLNGDELELKNLIGLPKIGGQCVLTLGSLDSLEGCPSEVNSDFKLNLRQNYSLSNLNFFPKHIKGDCEISADLKSFKGADGCIIDKRLWVGKSCKNLDGLPKAGDYIIGVHQNEIDQYFKLKKITTRLPELDGMF
jgi:hypothetical protein